MYRQSDCKACNKASITSNIESRYQSYTLLHLLDHLRSDRSSCLELPHMQDGGSVSLHGSIGLGGLLHLRLLKMHYGEEYSDCMRRAVTREKQSRFFSYAGTFSSSSRRPHFT